MINNEKNLKVGDMKNSGDTLNTAVNTVSALVDAAESGAFLLKSFFNDKVINMENKGENTENNGKRQIYMGNCYQIILSYIEFLLIFLLLVFKLLTVRVISSFFL